MEFAKDVPEDKLVLSHRLDRVKHAQLVNLLLLFLVIVPLVRKITTLQIPEQHLVLLVALEKLQIFHPLVVLHVH